MIDHNGQGDESGQTHHSFLVRKNLQALVDCELRTALKPSANTIRRASSFRGLDTTRPPLTNVALPEATSKKPSGLRKLLPGGTSMASSRPPLLRRRSGTPSGAWMAGANSLSRGPLLSRTAKRRLPTNRRPMHWLESKPPSERVPILNRTGQIFPNPEGSYFANPEGSLFCQTGKVPILPF